MSDLISRLQEFAQKRWYPHFIGLLAAIDNIILIIPNDGILISSAMLTPKHWLRLAFWTTVGSTIGALTLCLLVQNFGLDFLLYLFPKLQTTTTWEVTVHFFERFGLLLVFLVALAPVAQQPAVVLASLAAVNLPAMLALIFVGRFIKFTIMAWVASHAPSKLEKMWGVRSELKEVQEKMHLSVKGQPGTGSPSSKTKLTSA